jgi:hypothetical protein
MISRVKEVGQNSTERIKGQIKPIKDMPIVWKVNNVRQNSRDDAESQDTRIKEMSVI